MRPDKDDERIMDAIDRDPQYIANADVVAGMRWRTAIFNVLAVELSCVFMVSLVLSWQWGVGLIVYTYTQRLLLEHKDKVTGSRIILDYIEKLGTLRREITQLRNELKMSNNWDKTS